MLTSGGGGNMIDKEAEARAATRRQEKLAKRARNEQDAALRQLLRTAEGRAFIWWLLQIGKVGTQPFAGQNELTNFACGELNVGQQIFDRILETEPAGYLRLLEDKLNAEREHNAASLRSAAEPGDYDVSEPGSTD